MPKPKRIPQDLQRLRKLRAKMTWNSGIPGNKDLKRAFIRAEGLFAPPRAKRRRK